MILFAEFGTLLTKEYNIVHYSAYSIFFVTIFGLFHCIRRQTKAFSKIMKDFQHGI